MGNGLVPDQRAEEDTLSISSFFVTEWQFMSFLAAAMISSARHSSIGFLLPWDDSRAARHMFLSARSTLLAGATSTAFGTDMPPYWSLVTSSLGAACWSASTNTWSGLLLVLSWTRKKAFSTALYAFSFLPVKFSVRIMPLMSLSTMLILV